MTSTIAMFAAWGLVALYVLRMYRRQGLEFASVSPNVTENWFSDGGLPPKTGHAFLLGLALLSASFVYAALVSDGAYDGAVMFLIFGAWCFALDRILHVNLRLFTRGPSVKQTLVGFLLVIAIVAGCSLMVPGRDGLFAVPALAIAFAAVRALQVNRNESK